jgi:hypothetical protein
MCITTNFRRIYARDFPGDLFPEFFCFSRFGTKDRLKSLPEQIAGSIPLFRIRRRTVKKHGRREIENIHVSEKRYNKKQDGRLVLQSGAKKSRLLPLRP